MHPQADPNAYEPAVREKIEWRIKVTGESLRRAHTAAPWVIDCA